MDFSFQKDSYTLNLTEIFEQIGESRNFKHRDKSSNLKYSIPSHLMQNIHTNFQSTITDNSDESNLRLTQKGSKLCVLPNVSVANLNQIFKNSSKAINSLETNEGKQMLFSSKLPLNQKKKDSKSDNSNLSNEEEKEKFITNNKSKTESVENKHNEPIIIQYSPNLNNKPINSNRQQPPRDYISSKDIIPNNSKSNQKDSFKGLTNSKNTLTNSPDDISSNKHIVNEISKNSSQNTPKIKLGNSKVFQMKNDVLKNSKIISNTIYIQEKEVEEPRKTERDFTEQNQETQELKRKLNILKQQNNQMIGEKLGEIRQLGVNTESNKISKAPNKKDNNNIIETPITNNNPLSNELKNNNGNPVMANVKSNNGTINQNNTNNNKILNKIASKKNIIVNSSSSPGEIYVNVNNQLSKEGLKEHYNNDNNTYTNTNNDLLEDNNTFYNSKHLALLNANLNIPISNTTNNINTINNTNPGSFNNTISTVIQNQVNNNTLFSVSRQSGVNTPSDSYNHKELKDLKFSKALSPQTITICNNNTSLLNNITSNSQLIDKGIINNNLTNNSPIYTIKTSADKKSLKGSRMLPILNQNTILNNNSDNNNDLSNNSPNNSSNMNVIVKQINETKGFVEKGSPKPQNTVILKPTTSSNIKIKLSKKTEDAQTNTNDVNYKNNILNNNSNSGVLKNSNFYNYTINSGKGNNIPQNNNNTNNSMKGSSSFAGHNSKGVYNAIGSSNINTVNSSNLMNTLGNNSSNSNLLHSGLNKAETISPLMNNPTTITVIGNINSFSNSTTSNTKFTPGSIMQSKIKTFKITNNLVTAKSQSPLSHITSNVAGNNNNLTNCNSFKQFNNIASNLVSVSSNSPTSKISTGNLFAFISILN